MDTYTIARSKYRPAPGTQARHKTDFTVMSNEALKFAYDVVSLHDGLQEGDIMNEIAKRIDRGTWIQLDTPIPTMADNVPALFHIFPFSLLWSQRPR
jgi:hypothetical protein